MLRKIEQPDISDIKSERIGELLNHPGMKRLLQKARAPYCHWVKVKHWKTPSDIKPLEVWALIKLVRWTLDRRESIIKDEQKKTFSWGFLSGLEEFLHQVDMKLGGNLLISGTQATEEMQHRLLSRGVMEEAIASSQLEGAHTSRKAAKRIILEGRRPRNKDEHMIVNNYEAMQIIEKDLKDRKLDEETLFDLHRTLTKNTLEESEIGRYRKDDDNIVVGDSGSNEVYHIPPKENFIREEIKKFIDYANNDLKDPVFVHPVIKAILLHFWIGYLHPFVDGNGRMARALFYWYLLRENYWVFGYLPLSKVIKNSPGQYRDAFMFTEQDDNDLTYFIDYNVKKIIQAMREFEAYAERRWKENTRMAKIARERYQFNDRQIQLLRYYYKNKDVTTSITTHMKVYGTSRLTAMKDLKDLQGHGFLISKKVGRIVYYYATDKVEKLFD